MLKRMTLLQHWALATVIAVLPLLLVVGYSAYTLQRQIKMQRELAQQYDFVGKLTSIMDEQVIELVRISRQYQLLGESGFLDLYRKRSDILADALSQLKPLLSDSDARNSLNRIADTTDQAMKQLFEFSQAGNGRLLDNLLLSLKAQNEQLQRVTEDQKRKAMRDGDNRFKEIVSRLFALTAVALPITFLLMATGSIAISRPMRRLTEAIRLLGRQNFESPIKVSGPTDLAALGDSLEWMRRQIVAADQQKKAFVQHVTHELKTPLAAIIDAASLLLEGIPAPLDPEQRSVVKILLRNARNLQHLIQQLLNYNAVSHGLFLDAKSIRIGELCENLRRNLSESFSVKEISWHITGNPEMIHTDPRLMEMILGNLLANAVQYMGEHGSIGVSWSQQNDHWQLAVNDTGPGIPETELGEIFTPFFRGSSERSDDRILRNGLGLAIVRECVNILQGDIRVDSTPGQGTRFLMRFPELDDGQGL